MRNVSGRALLIAALSSAVAVNAGSAASGAQEASPLVQPHAPAALQANFAGDSQFQVSPPVIVTSPSSSATAASTGLPGGTTLAPEEAAGETTVASEEAAGETTVAPEEAAGETTVASEEAAGETPLASEEAAGGTTLASEEAAGGTTLASEEAAGGTTLASEEAAGGTTLSLGAPSTGTLSPPGGTTPAPGGTTPAPAEPAGTPPPAEPTGGTTPPPAEPAGRTTPAPGGPPGGATPAPEGPPGGTAPPSAPGGGMTPAPGGATGGTTPGPAATGGPSARPHLHRPGTDVDADVLSGSLASNVYVFKGNVTLHSDPKIDRDIADASESDEPLTVTADEIDVDKFALTYVAKGHVHFVQGDRSGRADIAMLDEQKHTLDLVGNADVVDGDHRAAAEKMHYNTLDRQFHGIGDVRIYEPLPTPNPNTSATPAPKHKRRFPI